MFDFKINNENFEVVTIENRERWDEIINKSQNSDIYNTYNYIYPYYKNNEGTPILIYFQISELFIYNVVLLRKIPNLPKKISNDNLCYFDLITPYGYGGPVIEGELSNESILDYYKNYYEFCENNNILTEFIRFNPLQKIENQTKEFYGAELLGPTVTVKIESYEQVWNNYSSKNRNIIRKTHKTGLQITHDYNKYSFDKFKKLYLTTMRGVSADKYYYFSDDYFESLYIEMRDKSLIFNVVFEDEVIASALILFHNKKAHYHLSGSNYEYRNLNATSFLLDEVIKYSLENGYNKLHLGGGVGARKDSLFKFKRSFNPESTTQYYIGKKVYNREIYDRIAKDLGMENEMFFPKYRGKKEGI